MDEILLGGNRRARVGYDLDDLSLVPARRTRDPALVDLTWTLDAYDFEIPIVSAALDAVTSPSTAVTMHGLGGLPVLNLEGLWTRHDDPAGVLAEIVELDPGPRATQRLREIYRAPVRAELIGQRVEQLRKTGVAAGALSPGKVERHHAAALEAGLDLLVVQGFITTAQHVGDPEDAPLDLRSFTARYDIPVVVSGVGSAKSAMHLMRTGAVGIIVGVGSGLGSTTGEVLGVAAPLATAIAEVADARSRYLAESGRYVQVISGGSIRTGGDVAKAIALGADAVMVASPLSQATDSPAPGAYWGLASGHRDLPRGRFVRREVAGTIAEVIAGPSDRDDGSRNLVGALRRSMAACGYEDLRAFQQAELALHR